MDLLELYILERGKLPPEEIAGFLDIDVDEVIVLAEEWKDTENIDEKTEEKSEM